MSKSFRMSLSRHDEPVTPPEGGKPAGTPPEGDTSSSFKPITITSQAEYDAIAKDRLARQKAQFADYDDLKSKAAKLAEIEAANLSELEKANAKAADADARAAAAEAKAEKTALKSAIVDAARVAGAVDPGDVMALLPDGAVTVDKDGNVVGATEAVAALLASKPHLKGTSKPAGDVDQGNRNGGQPTDFRTADPKVVRAELSKLGVAPRL